MSGFAESASTEEIGALARKKRVPFVEDLGSGAVVPTEELGIADHEPTPVEALKRGADLVCFSGDKLFGGPQAGIIAGKKRLIVAWNPPVIGYVAGDRFKLDLRTIFPHQDEAVIEAIRTACANLL